MTCADMFDASFSPAIDDAALLSSTVAVCRNGQCFRTSLADLKFDALSGKAIKAVVDDEKSSQTQAPRIDLVAYAREDAASPHRLQVVFNAWDNRDFADGDTYSIALKGGDGAVLYEKTMAVTYSVKPVCGATCAQARVDSGTE